MIVINATSILKREIERWQNIKKQAGNHYKSFPFNDPGRSGLHIEDTIRRLRALQLQVEATPTLDKIRDILGSYASGSITCDECHKEVEAIVVFEDTGMEHECGPAGICKNCLTKAVEMLI